MKYFESKSLQNNFSLNFKFYQNYLTIFYLSDLLRDRDFLMCIKNKVKK